MNLNITILSEVSQTEKDKYMILLICGILKKKEPIQMSLYTTQKQTHRQKKQMYGYQRGKWVGRIYEFEINMNQKKTPEAVFNKGLLSTY